MMGCVVEEDLNEFGIKGKLMLFIVLIIYVKDVMEKYIILKLVMVVFNLQYVGGFFVIVQGV